MKKRIKNFGDTNLQKCNKFDFEVGKKYEFDELPKKLKKDVSTMFLEDFYSAPEEYTYVCTLLTPEDMWDMLGEDAFNNVENFDIDEAQIKINKEGLDYPVVGSGNYKMMIYTILEEDLPYLEMRLKPDFES